MQPAIKGIMSYWITPHLFSWSNQDKVKNIIKIVSRETGIHVPHIINKNGKRDVVEARQLCFLLIRKYTTCTLKMIGLQFSGLHHSTILYGIHHIEDIIETDKRVKIICARIEIYLENMEYIFDEPKTNQG